MAEPSKPTPFRPWKLPEIADTRENVRESILAAAFVPPGAKAMLAEAIDLAFPDARLIKFGAHVHVNEMPKQGGKKKLTIAVDISEL